MYGFPYKIVILNYSKTRNTLLDFCTSLRILIESNCLVIQEPDKKRINESDKQRKQNR